MGPKYSPSVICESTVLTSVSPAMKAARKSRGEGMRGLSGALREKLEGREISFHTKAQERSCTEEKPRPAGGAILGVPQGSALLNIRQRDPECPLHNQILCFP